MPASHHGMMHRLPDCDANLRCLLSHLTNSDFDSTFCELFTRPKIWQHSRPCCVTPVKVNIFHRGIVLPESFSEDTDILTVHVALQRSSTSVDHASNLVLVFCASSRQESRRRWNLQVGINCISLPDVSVSGMGACQRAGRQLLQHMLWGIIHVQKQ